MLTEGMVNITTAVNRPLVGGGNIICELFSNNGGTPGVRIGASVVKPLHYLSAGTLNSIPLTGAGMIVSRAAEYFFVISLSDAKDTLKVRTDQANGARHSAVLAADVWRPMTNNLRVRAELTSQQGAASADAQGMIPLEWKLYQNYPNPFNPSTVISYAIPVKAVVTLKVFDILGREVADLVHDEQPAGAHRVAWDGRTARGVSAAAGVYVYRLDAAGGSHARMMVRLK
jgi:hypothetical protein